MSHRVHKFSSLARPLEPQYPTNLAVIILLPAIAIGLFAWMVIGGNGMLDAGKAGLLGMLAAFISWALGREMDPDHNATAFIAMALAVLAAGLGYGFDLLSMAALLFAARVVNRTVGPQAKAGDIVMLFLFNLGALFIDGAWWMPFISAAALAIDEVFERSNMVQRITMLMLVLIGFQSLLIGNQVDLAAYQTLIRGWVVTVVVITILVAANIPGTKDIRANMDVLGTPCQARRVQAGMAIILLAGLASLSGGQMGLTEALGIWAVLAASLIGRNISFVPKTEKPSED